MATNNPTPFTRQTTRGWALLAAGLIFLLVGVALRLALPGSAVNPKWVMAFGVLFSGLAIVDLAKTLTARLDPKAARRMVIEEKDERSRALRDRAGHAAFIFSIGVACLVLLVYSSATWKAPGFDPVWAYLAFTVLGPGLVYIFSLIWYNSRY